MLVAAVCWWNVSSTDTGSDIRNSGSWTFRMNPNSSDSLMVHTGVSTVEVCSLNCGGTVPAVPAASYTTSRTW